MERDYGSQKDQVEAPGTVPPQLCGELTAALHPWARTEVTVTA